MLTSFPEQCLVCKHLHREAPGLSAMHCDAFPAPELIPEEILGQHIGHTQPFPGDRGIRFEPIDNDPAEPQST